MKQLLFALLLVCSATPVLACNTPVDAKKAVLFIDTNMSLLEIQAARTSACTRGETFVLVPYDEAFAKKVLDVRQAIDPLRSEMNRINGASTLSAAQKKRATTLLQQIEGLQKKQQDLLASRPPFEDAVKDRLQQLAHDDVAIKAVVMSGHDGGGAIRGELGGTDKTAFAKMMHEAYADKKMLESQLDTVLMWGCYTATPVEVMEWREEFPKLKILAGFFDSGPSNVRPASFELMQDLLIKASEIAKKCDEKELKSSIRGLTHLTTTLAGMSVRNKCDVEYYYARRMEGEGAAKRLRESFGIFDGSCKGSEVDAIKKGLNDEFSLYLIGVNKIPENTATSPLRSLYSTVRGLEHCIEANSLISPDRVGLLLFYKGLHENFFKVFQQESLQAAQDFAVMIGSFPEYKEVLRDAGISLPLDLPKATLDRQQLVMVSSVLVAVAVDDRPFPEEVKTIQKRLLKYQQSLDRLLFQVDMNCMSFLEWHEAKPGVTPRVLCEN